MPTWKLRENNKSVEQELLQNDPSIHKLKARLLAQREIGKERVEDFCKSSYQSLMHPSILSGTEESAKLFCEAAKKKYTFAVIGDYDCDGIFSSVMIKTLCDNFGLECKVFLPSRFDHGYGLNPKTIASFKASLVEPPDFLFVLDCGSNNEKEVLELKEYGVKNVVIIDHHVVDPELQSNSADYLVNWRLCDPSTGAHEMCTCGEVYQFIRAIRRITKKVDPIEYLSYAAIGTIADSSPLIGDNRIIVRHGLTAFALSHVVGVGLHALISQANIKTKGLCQDDVAFRMAPRINAAGRMIAPDIAYGLLTELDAKMAKKIATQLDVYNNDRKLKQKTMEKEAVDSVEQNLDNYKYGIMIHSDNWHTGIVGITASRIVETFKKPSIVIGSLNGVWKGSGRSLKGVNIKEICDTCSRMFNNYGGHDFAVGVNIRKEMIQEANEIFNEACRLYYEDHEIPDESTYYDAELRPSTISLETAKVLKESLQPYCQQFNEEPVFLVRDVQLKNVKLHEGATWNMLTFEGERDGEDVALDMRLFTDDFGTEIDGQLADIYFKFPQTLEPTYFGYPPLNIVDIDVK